MTKTEIYTSDAKTWFYSLDENEQKRILATNGIGEDELQGSDVWKQLLSIYGKEILTFVNS